MAAQVLSFFQRSPRLAPKPSDWSQQELAEFYRVESALIRAGIRVGTDRGLSDENEPWFVFYRSDDGEVVIHFARIDGEYLIAGPAYEEIARGFDFSALVRNLVARHPLIRRSESSNISVHPAALLVAVVGTAFFKTGEARAAESGATNGHSGQGRPALLSSSSVTGLVGVAPVSVPTAYETAQIPANQAVLILAAAMFASDFGVDASTVDPAAKAAIAAAAASLDFGVPTTSAHVAEGGVVLSSATTHLQAIDTTPVKTISSVLSLVAVLSTMPARLDAPLGDEALLSASAHIGRPDQPLSSPLAPLEAGAWTIDVRLGFSMSDLPSVEAVQLVRSVAGEAAAQKISVIEVAKLPDVLAALIANGDHYGVAPTHAQPVGAPPPVAVVPSPAPAPAPEPSAEAPPTPTPPVQDNTPPDLSTPVSPPTDPIQTPAPAPVEPQPSPTKYASPNLVKQFIDYFIAHTPSVEVIVKDFQIVMFDARVLHDAGTVGHLYSMTFDFIDGSSISLVGDHSSFLHGGLLV